MSNTYRGKTNWKRRPSGGWRGRGWRGRGSWPNRGRGYHNNSEQGQSEENPPTSQISFEGNKENLKVLEQSMIQTTLLDLNTPYKGWNYHFPDEVYSDNSSIVKKTKVFEKVFNNQMDHYNLSSLEDKQFFTVDYRELKTDSIIANELPEFSKELKQTPEVVIKCLGLAMHQVMTLKLKEELQDASLDSLNTQGSVSIDEGDMPSIPKLNCRILNYEPISTLKDLKANCYDLTLNSEEESIVLLPDGKYVVPTKCVSAGCYGRTFHPKRDDKQTETIDWQMIRLQEIINDEHTESGRIPRTLDCVFTEDLVDSCVPGEMVKVSGIVKVRSSDEGRSHTKDKCMFVLYLHANSVTNAKAGGRTDSIDLIQPSSSFDMEFTMKELYAIEELQSRPELFRLVVRSLCPAIYGHEIVKAGLVLGLFGGSQKYINDLNHIPVRGDLHILIVGDPGLGKSQMLQAVTNVAPRSVYVCGNTTTISGLTVTLCKEGGGHGDYVLEAGALVLADQGCCCIDEFDKMGNQHQALLEAMEQQSISIAKAGIVCSLPARTSIIAAANPAGGHYNKAKTVAENIRMGSALLSRFDLVFILLDKPDEEMDSMLSEHVMALHAGKRRRLDTSLSCLTSRSETVSKVLNQWNSEKTLIERLKLQRDEQLDPIPPSLLRKYVGYARKYVHPKIGPEAAHVIQKFYLDLRKRHQTQESTPITTRQLESLIRLTEARARTELREVATEDDAKDVVEMMKYSMIDTYSDERGFLDFTRSQHGSGMSKKGKVKKLVVLLQKQAEKAYNSLFTVQEIKQIAEDARLNILDFEELITSLNHHGFLIKKGPRVYQLQTAGF